MFFPTAKLKKLEQKGTGYTCHDQFRVASIDYDGRSICEVAIEDITSKQIVRFGQPAAAKREQESIEKQGINEVKVKALEKRCLNDGIDIEALKGFCNVSDISDLTEKKYANINAHWDQVLDRFGKKD